MQYTCKWCGKQFDGTQAFQGGVRFYQTYCSKRCENAGERARQEEQQRQKESTDELLRKIGGGKKKIGCLVVLALSLIAFLIFGYGSSDHSGEGNPEVIQEDVDSHLSLEEESNGMIMQLNDNQNANEDLWDAQEPDQSVLQYDIVEEDNLIMAQSNNLEQSEGAGNRRVVIDGSELRLRLGPSTSSDTFKWPDGTNRHPNVGDIFNYLGESGDFYKIDFNGYELWVSKQYTHIEEDQTNSSNQAETIINELSSHKVIEEIAHPIVIEEITPEQEIYQIVDEMPQFPGGDAKLLEYLATHINYPKEAQDAGVQGRVFVGFVVEPDGSVSNVKVLKGIGSGCDEEAVRVINSLPLFMPGKQHGKAVRVSYQIPVLFKL